MALYAVTFVHLQREIHIITFRPNESSVKIFTTKNAALRIH